MPKTTRRGGRTAGPTLGVRERILGAALEILRESGLQALTQVRVSERAGVRQSHLTYYFPTRQDLLAGVTAHVVEGIIRGAQHAIEGQEGQRRADPDAVLSRLAAAVTDLGHMRMFLGMIIEADADPGLRRTIVSGARRIEMGLARSLGGRDARARARVLLAAIWGLGLYRFVTRSLGRGGLTRPYLAWLGSTVTLPSRPRG